MDTEALRRHVVDLLTSRGAHVDFDAAVRRFPPELRGACPEGHAHSAWQLLEHLRIAQWDILEFSRDPDHVSPKWPEEYFPESPAPPDEGTWDRSVETFRAELREMCDLVRDPAIDLFAEIPWGDGQTILREALLVADHNAYHVGQVVTLRRALGAWPPIAGIRGT